MQIPSHPQTISYVIKNKSNITLANQTEAPISMETGTTAAKLSAFR
jgi:hypothetical protein